PTLVTNSKEMSFKQYGRYLVRHLKRHIKKPDGSPLFVPADPSKPMAVTLTQAEANVHAAVAKQAATLDKQAEKLKAERDRYALRLVATILRKRAASSLSALRETVANRLENLEHEAEEVELRRDHLRSLRKGETISDGIDNGGTLGAVFAVKQEICANVYSESIRNRTGQERRELRAAVA